MFCYSDGYKNHVPTKSKEHVKGDVEVVTRDCIVQLSGMRMRDTAVASSLKWVCGEQVQAQVLSVSCWEGIYEERDSCDIRE